MIDTDYLCFCGETHTGPWALIDYLDCRIKRRESIPPLRDMTIVKRIESVVRDFELRRKYPLNRLILQEDAFHDYGEALLLHTAYPPNLPQLQDRIKSGVLSFEGTEVVNTKEPGSRIFAVVGVKE